MTTATAARKAERRVQLSDYANGTYTLTLTITGPRVKTSPKVTVNFYYLTRLDSAFGLAFRLEKPAATPEVYDVNIDLQRGYHSCTCKGNTYCGHCKHAEAILALLKAGKIDVPQQPVPEPIEFDDP